jgi:hypothetical protein
MLIETDILLVKRRGSHAIDDFPNPLLMTKTELQTALAEAKPDR